MVDAAIRFVAGEALLCRPQQSLQAKDNPDDLAPGVGTARGEVPRRLG